MFLGSSLLYAIMIYNKLLVILLKKLCLHNNFRFYYRCEYMVLCEIFFWSKVQILFLLLGQICCQIKFVKLNVRYIYLTQKLICSTTSSHSIFSFSYLIRKLIRGFCHSYMCILIYYI